MGRRVLLGPWKLLLRRVFLAAIRSYYRPVSPGCWEIRPSLPQPNHPAIGVTGRPSLDCYGEAVYIKVDLLCPFSGH